MDMVRTGPRGVLRAARLRAAGGVQTIIIDVDGTLTDGKMYMGASGRKLMKAFSADDSDAIKRAVSLGIRVILISADRTGFAISEARAKDMGVDIYFGRGYDRIKRVQSFYGTVFIGDGYSDAACFMAADYGFATANALPKTKRRADAVGSRRGGDKAVAQAIDYVLAKTYRRKGMK